MNAGKTVFAQILEHLPRYEFDKFVKEYEGNRRVVSSFLCKIFIGQFFEERQVLTHFSYRV